MELTRATSSSNTNRVNSTPPPATTAHNGPTTLASTITEVTNTATSRFSLNADGASTSASALSRGQHSQAVVPHSRGTDDTQVVINLNRALPTALFQQFRANTHAEQLDVALNMVHNAGPLEGAVHQALEAQIRALPPEDHAGAQQVADGLTALLGDMPGEVLDQQQPAIRALAEGVREAIRHVNQLRQADNLPRLTPLEQQTHALAWLNRMLLRNEGDGTLARLAGNLSVTALRAGIATFVGTFVRNLMGFSLQQVMNAGFNNNYNATNATHGHNVTWADSTRTSSTNTTPEWVHALGAVMVALPLALHLAGGIRDGISGAASSESSVLRVAHGTLAMGAVGVAAATGNCSPMVTWTAMIGMYALFRGIGTAMMQYDSNASAPAGTQLLRATTAYAGAQGVAGFVQGELGLQAGPDTSTIKAKLTPQQIRDATLPLAANLGHSILNASLEIFDDLQGGAWSRNAIVEANQAAWREGLTPERHAQLVAAGLQATLLAAQAEPNLDENALRAACVSGMQRFKEHEFEGLRMSLSRQTPTHEQQEQCIQGSVAALNALNYFWTPDATQGRELQNNQVMQAFVFRELDRLSRAQPLARPFGGSISSATQRLINQSLSGEAHRQDAFQTLIGLTYAAESSLLASLMKQADSHGASAIDGVVTALGMGVVYPIFYCGLTSRQLTPAETRQQQAEVTWLRQTIQTALNNGTINL